MKASAESNMPRNFDFAEAEPRLYKWWEQQGWFKPEVAGADAEPFVISMPPPNVTGSLHLGHALFGALEDLMIRYQRMRGKASLWVPGTDHAGIATQLQVENMLREEGRQPRRSRLRRISCIVLGNGKTNMAAPSSSSCAVWAPAAIGIRERFTLDDGLSEAVSARFS